MTSQNTDDSPRESERTPDPLPGDELYMMTGGVYILCSVDRPSTRWMASAGVADLGDWR